MDDNSAKNERSDFWGSLRMGALIGLAVLVLVIPPLKGWVPMPGSEPTASSEVSTPRLGPVDASPAEAPAEVAQGGPAQAPSVGSESAPATDPAARARGPLRLADFGAETPSVDARRLANWVVHTRNNERLPFFMVDKKFAKVYVFTPDGKLHSTTPVLLGEAVGDDSVPGIGDKPLSQVKPWEKTTPAGRFVAEMGMNLNGEDVIWVDYDAAVSMHRIRKVKESERRYERMASATHLDNRISNGCINVPKAFYEQVLAPTVQRSGAVIYVLPETKPVDKVFGSWDVEAGASHLAQVSTQSSGTQIAGGQLASKR